MSAIYECFIRQLWWMDDVVLRWFGGISSLERAFTSLLRGCKWCFLQAAWFLTAGAYALEGSSTRGCQRHEQNHNGCCYENHWPNFCVRSHLLIPSVACFCPSKLMMAISSILIPKAGASGVGYHCVFALQSQFLASLQIWAHSAAFVFVKMWQWLLFPLLGCFFCSTLPSFLPFSLSISSLVNCFQRQHH